MKILLTTLNAKFIHSSLALAYLQVFCQADHDTQIREYTINEPVYKILADIYTCQPDVVCFSCYIWNIELIKTICADLKQVLPSVKIIAGGPEVSYDAMELLAENPAIDYVIRGEGEMTLWELLPCIQSGISPEDIAGVSYRQQGIVENQERPLIQNLDDIPFPYENNLAAYKNKIIYYETSRGCPFNCSYCLSSTIKGVRYFSLERVKKDMKFLMDNKIPQVKFVDRTFNADEKRARSIMEFIIANNQVTSFHFEIDATILSAQMLTFLRQVPTGMFDFEIGVQSTYPPTLDAVNRNSNWKKQRENIVQLLGFGNVHIHLDLIAGLPQEGYERFGDSFNDVYDLAPDVIQLGFLKLLKGSPLYRQHREHDYRFSVRPPYQVLENQYITYPQLLKLSLIEDLLSRYYNTGMAVNLLNAIISHSYQRNAFAFWQSLAEYLDHNDFFRYGHNRIEEYKRMHQFIQDCHQENPLYFELLKLDFLINNRERNLPPLFVSHNPDDNSEILYSWLKDAEFIVQYIPEFQDRPPREIRRQVRLEYLRLDAYFQLADQPVPTLFVYNKLGAKARIIRLNE